MDTVPLDTPTPAGLRALARHRLQQAAQAGAPTTLGPEALAVLMRLALDPAHAEDALVLQQELQLHQIEIELLAESRQAAAAGSD